MYYLLCLHKIIANIKIDIIFYYLNTINYYIIKKNNNLNAFKF